jgi:hypothetical protein
MSYLPPTDQFQDATSEKFAVTRSEWLDAFSELEVAILRCASRIGLNCDAKKTPLAVRLGNLRDAPASPRLSKSSANELKSLASACEKLLAIRAAIVHSKMRCGTYEGTPAAFFQNVLDAAESQPFHTVLKLDDFERMRSDLIRFAGRFDAITLNPSEPLRPKPAEAAGP